MGFFSFRQFFHLGSRATPEEIIARFLRRPEHAWIVRDRPLLRSLDEFFSLLPSADLVRVLEERRLLLLYCNQRMSCAFHQYRGREIVLIFPDLRRLLTSAQYLQGHAVLAHEIGHVWHGHARRALGALQAQLEADRYATGLGLREDLVAVLREEGTSNEIHQRLAALAP